MGIMPGARGEREQAQRHQADLFMESCTRSGDCRNDRRIRMKREQGKGQDVGVKSFFVKLLG